MDDISLRAVLCRLSLILSAGGVLFCLAAIPFLRHGYPFLPRGLLFLLAVFTYDLTRKCFSLAVSCHPMAFGHWRRKSRCMLYAGVPVAWYTIAAVYLWIS